jgi:uncharacterized Ntn-hydrolase superfamily protein
MSENLYKAVIYLMKERDKYMNREDVEWELLDKRINDSPDPVVRTLRRATIKIDDEMSNLIKEVLNHNRESLTINTKVIEGLLLTDEIIEITLITTDGEED